MKKLGIFLIIFLILFIVFPHTVAFAQSTIASEILDERIARYSFYSVYGASIMLFILTGISLTRKKMSSLVKNVLFGGMVVIVISTTLFLAGSTVYLNVVSESGGPVHYHADIQVWSCGKELDFRNPQGLSNKIGTATFHEHNDKRIHVEGVVVQEQDINLGRFFHVIGGKLTSNTLEVPTDTGLISHVTGEQCGSDKAEVQVFVYKVTEHGVYKQEKLHNPITYVLTGEQSVPSGDCIIVEFDKKKDQTDKLCMSYKVAEQTGKIRKEYYGN